jgi:pimeloyl-ACP methyl ester carboxylesterase
MRRDYHVLALDQRGHGGSGWSRTGSYGVHAHMRDIHGFVKALGLKKFVLVGLSMGGRNSIVYSAMHPERVDRLVIVDIGPEPMKKGIENIRRFARRADVLPTFEAFVQRAHEFNPRRPIKQLRDRLRWNLRRLPDGRWTWKYDRRFRAQRAAAGREDLWTYVRRIKAPALLVRGAESDILSAQGAKRTQRAIANCRLVTIPKAGHTVPGDNPPAFAAAVRAFLAATKRRAARNLD